ncbi:GntR family transcriptional regulator [Streptomyces bobili]|uniref:GntR family transcriptional regulator n=1 Tax=Streptomyces bobili TaxID=67280 RepID=UPI0034267C60
MSEWQGGDSGGREFHRVSETLRSRIAAGVYPPGSFLPSQRALAEELGVSRDTVQRVMRELAEDGWVESRQGSGSRVVRTGADQAEPVPTGPAEARSRRSPAGLGEVLSRVFAQPEVTLDVYTLTSETLDAHIRLQAERIASGLISPDRVTLRLLLPSPAVAMPYPQVKGDPADTRLRARLHEITERHTASLHGTLEVLKTQGYVPSVHAQVRYAPLTPAFKAYLFNGAEMLIGPYEVIERRIPLSSGEEVESLDVLGLGAQLTHHVRDDDPNSQGSVFVGSWQSWFESVWGLLAE